MYGTFTFASFGAVAFVILLLVALLFLASPLIAVILTVIAAVGMLLAMSALRQRSRREDETGGRGAPLTPEGRPTSPTGSRSGGEPASGEG